MTVAKSLERRNRFADGSTGRKSMSELTAQADSSLRPLRRRADTMARPARVRMRNRKPCVFARRRLFGWKVRLLTVGLHRYEGQALIPDDRVGAACNPK